MIDVCARDHSGARNGLRFLLRGLSVVLVILFSTSCGNSIFIPGTPVITLTAQPGNFTSYIVTIDEIELTRNDGTVVPLPSASNHVDLARLSSMVQFLEAPAVEEGTYVSATFFLDYASSHVTVGVGGTAGATTLVDASTGTTPTVDTITVKFDPNNPLVIGNQTSSPVNFNIDLEASNTVNYSNGLPATVTVHPLFTATATPVYDKPVFTRGLFVFVDSNAGTFTLNTRPLHDVLNSGNGLGAVTVIPNDQTYYNINGVPYTGAAGLKALTALQSQTAVLQVAAVGTNPFGNLSKVTPSFTATQVYAGSSLESTIQDHITGIVAARSSNTLTVIGAGLVDRVGQFGYAQSIPVTIASSTIVSVDGANVTPTPNINSVSVGQFIDVSGQDSITTDGLNDPTALDATNGQIRLQPSTLWGTLNSATAGSASVSLVQVDRFYQPGQFNFAGTGVNSGVDAQAASYNVNTGSTDESATAPGTLLKIVGLATPFGSAPPDFAASTIAPIASLPQQLVIEWSGNGSPSPFTVLAGAGLGINLQDTTLARAVILNGPQTTNVTALTNPNPTVLTVVPATGTPQSQYLFTVGNVLNNVSVFNDPASFATSVQSYISTAGAVRKLVATGQYDGAGNFVATDIEIAVK